MELVKKIDLIKYSKIILLVLLGSVLLTISAKVKIPFYPVPMTMQTFVVLFLGMALGPKIGLTTISLYLLEGIFGFPVFANSPEKGIGLIYFTGPTMGYLIGFLIAAFFAGLLTSQKNKNNYLNVFFKLLFSVSFIYFLGLIWLGFLIGWDKPIFKLGAQPFLLAELFKLILLTVLYPWIIKINIKLFG
tara:strand:- start:7275 stop:7841 length:567 start_codon:yes stop_codon:yes gene_type:complete